MQSRAHTEFLSWGWDVLLKLKLHETDMQQQNSRDDDDDDHGDASSVNTEGETLPFFLPFKFQSR